MKTTVKIVRRQPEQEQSYIQTYSYDFSPGMSVLNVLETVGREDATLRYAHCCDGACCGICAVQCNGRPGLACRIPAVPNMLIAPLDGLPVLVDLIPDRDVYDARRGELMLYSSGTDSSQPPCPLEPKTEERIRAAARCFECLSCLSVCPVFQKEFPTFAGPCHFALIARHVFDPRDSLNRLETLHKMNPQLCIQCGACSRVCPTDTGPAELIRVLSHRRLPNAATAENDSFA